MIECANDIIKAALRGAQDAYSEITLPVALGNEFPQIVIDGTKNALRAMHLAWGNTDIVAGLGSALYQVTVVANFVEGLRPEVGYRRAMSQIAKSLSDQVEILTEEDRKEKYEDVSYFTQDDEYNVAILVAASHIISAAARNFRTADEAGLAAFIAAELAEGNPFLLADIRAIKVAASK